MLVVCYGTYKIPKDSCYKLTYVRTHMLGKFSKLHVGLVLEMSSSKRQIYKITSVDQSARRGTVDRTLFIGAYSIAGRPDKLIVLPTEPPNLAGSLSGSRPD